MYSLSVSLSSAAAVVSPFLIKAPSVVLLFKNTVLALVSTKPNRLVLFLEMSRYVLLCNLSLILYQRGGLIMKDYMS